jgi:hypothetical protein
MTRQAEPVAWQDKATPTEIVAAEDWENIDPAWHWMYRPLYAAPQQVEPDAVLAEREACATIIQRAGLPSIAAAIRARGRE